MESERVELLREGYARFNRGDYDGLADLMSEDVLLQNMNPLATEHVGRQAVRAWMEPDAFELQIAEPQTFEEQGSRVLVEILVTVRGRGSGLETRLPLLHLWDLDETGSRITRLRAYSADDRAEAEAALAAP